MLWINILKNRAGKQVSIGYVLVGTGCRKYVAYVYICYMYIIKNMIREEK